MAENQTIIDLLRRANSQLDAQNNEPGGADRPTPGLPSSALEPVMKGTLGAVGDVVGGIMGLPKQFMDASARDVLNLGDHTQPKESVGPAAEIAMNLAGFGAPAAERGAAGIFGGKLAKTADLRALQEAQQMTAGGKFSDDIFHDTGWFRGPADQKWRFEIPDNKMKLKYWPSGEGETARASVGALIDHPELYKAYPALQSAGLALSKDSRVPSGTGMFNPGQTGFASGGRIDVNAPDHKVARSVAGHELQHGVQAIEGFSFGTDPSHIAGLIEKGLKKNPELLGGNKWWDVVQKAEPLYYKTAGEVEARNVQNRLDFSPESRRGIGPWYTQDTNYAEQYHLDPLSGMLKALREK